MEKLRLGGMALQNGVLVHGPTTWAAAVRLEDGTIKTASGPKPRLGAGVGVPLVRGHPAGRGVRAAAVDEACAARGPPPVRAAVGRRGARRSLDRRELRAALVPADRPTRGGVLIASLVPALVVALRRRADVVHHGAEHVSIGTYETGEPAAKEHERCGSHLSGRSCLRARSPLRRRLRGAAPDRGAVLRRSARCGAAVEVFGWMSRNPASCLTGAVPAGTELQRRLSTSEPTAEQLEVAEAALEAVLAAEAAA